MQGKNNRMKLSRDEALQVFRAIKREGLWQTYHFAKRAQERRFSMEDVFEVAENGVMSRKSPTYKPEHDDWSYTIVGKDMDGNRIRIVFVITSDRRVKLITGYKSNL